MKISQRCPKCGGSDICCVPGKVGPGGAGNNIPVGMTIFTSVLVNRYLCCSCGYSEEWIDQKDIKAIQQKYSKA